MTKDEYFALVKPKYKNASEKEKQELYNEGAYFLMLTDLCDKKYSMTGDKVLDIFVKYPYLKELFYDRIEFPKFIVNCVTIKD
jgi:hypothetical protein